MRRSRPAEAVTPLPGRRPSLDLRPVRVYFSKTVRRPPDHRSAVTVTTWRVAAALMAALWTLVPAATALHGAVEAHAYCQEHDAFEEGRGHAGSIARGGDTAQDGGDAARVATAPDVAGGDAHAPCAFARAVLADAAPAVPAASVSGPAPAILPLRLPASRVPAPRAVPLLAVAPKSSPPVRA